MEKLNLDFETDNKNLILDEIVAQAEARGYSIEEVDSSRPWGGFIRLANSDAKKFIEEFFPGLSLEEAQYGVEGAELSPKFLLVSPGQRLSWQRHDRRAERWTFLNQGGYHKSMVDEDQGDLIIANEGDVVQFDCGERHRLVGAESSFTVVAEIWQHTDPANPSNEDDIVRIQDDYAR